MRRRCPWRRSRRCAALDPNETLQLFGALVLYLIGLELGRGATSYFVVSIGFFMLCAFILSPHVFRKPVQLLLTGVAACVLCGFIGWGFSQVLYVSLP